MPNDRLRAALLKRGITIEALAQAVAVDAKTVERWITKNRMPYRRHRYSVATRLGMDEAYLWPTALSPEQALGASESEIVTVYPHRWAVPNEMWRHVFETAEEEIGILVYSGLFVAEDTGIQRVLQAKADAGVRVRILLGDPGSETVSRRGADEGIDETMAGKIRNALVLYRSLRSMDGVEFRLHETVLYNSIYRADEQVLVNTHIYGLPAAQAPVLHLHRVAGGNMVGNYLESFEKVWHGATPLE
jgi:transcriptional regulator with XRE-family HTH domain